jgi:hypothetical protein
MIFISYVRDNPSPVLEAILLIQPGSKSFRLHDGAGRSLSFGLGFPPHVSGVRALVGLNILEAAIAVAHGVQLGALAATVRGAFCLSHGCPPAD